MAAARLGGGLKIFLSLIGSTEMSKKVALVTGGMGGLGTAICRALAEDGFVVVANCLPGFPQKDDWLTQNKAAGFEFHAAEGNVADYESCKRDGQAHRIRIGPVDVLVNNAGITRDKCSARCRAQTGMR
jgi:acetoacetyl-CoA reductase